MAKHDVTKIPFSKKKTTDFSEILVADVKLMLEKVLKVSRRYLLPFVIYQEKLAGGAFFAPPPSVRRVLRKLSDEIHRLFIGWWPVPSNKDQ